MSTDFVVASKNINDRFSDNVSKGDVLTYTFDFSPWAEDNNPLTSVTWVCESGGVVISNQSLVDNVATARLAFNEQGRSLISLLAETSAEKKKIWLEVRAKDVYGFTYDYGMNS